MSRRCNDGRFQFKVPGSISYPREYYNIYVTTNDCACACTYVYVAVTGRKRTLFHCKWANSISYISRMLYWNHSRFSVSLYEWLNSMHSKFQSHSYWQSLVIAVWISITPPTLMFVFYLWLPHIQYVQSYVHAHNYVHAHIIIIMCMIDVQYRRQIKVPIPLFVELW